MVYVDTITACLPNSKWRHKKSCHMYADTLEELHVMANHIGLKISWFQDHPKLPHYDLTPSKRRLAISHGAKSVDRRHTGWYLKEKKDEQDDKNTKT